MRQDRKSLGIIVLRPGGETEERWDMGWYTFINGTVRRGRRCNVMCPVQEFFVAIAQCVLLLLPRSWPPWTTAIASVLLASEIDHGSATSKNKEFFFVNYREMSNGKMIFYRMVWFLKGPRVRRDTQTDTRRFSGAWIGLVRSGRCGPSSFFHVERLQLQLERARRDFLLAL